MSDEEIITRLVTVRGIGRWTAEMYLMFELRRLDVWPVDDLGVRQGYGLAWSSIRRRPRASCSPSATGSGPTVQSWRGIAGKRSRSPAAEPTLPCGSDAGERAGSRRATEGSGRAVVVDHPAQQVDKLTALARGQGGEQRILEAVEDHLECLEAPPAGRGDGDDVPTAIGGVQVASDQPVTGQRVDQGDHVAAVDAAPTAQRRLAGRSELVERGQHCVMRAMGPDRAQSVAH